MNMTVCEALEQPRIEVRPNSPARRPLQLLRTWYRRSQGRRRLLQLDDRLLKDIGLSRAEALAEAGKPFWRL